MKPAGSARGSQLPSPLFARPAAPQQPQVAIAATDAAAAASSDWDDDDDTASSSSGSSSSPGYRNVGGSRSSHDAGQPTGVGVGAHVLFDFEASGPGELSVARGQAVRALYHVDRRWLFVLTQTGQVGYIPFLYASKEDWTRWRPVPSLRRYCRGLTAAAGDASSDSGNCDTGSSSNSSGGGAGAETSAAAEGPRQQLSHLCLPADLTKPPVMTENRQAGPASALVHLTVGGKPAPGVAAVSRAATLPHATGFARTGDTCNAATLPSRRMASSWHSALLPVATDSSQASTKMTSASGLYLSGTASSYSTPYATPSRQLRPYSLRLDHFGGVVNQQAANRAADPQSVADLHNFQPHPQQPVLPIAPPAPRRQRRPSFDSAMAATATQAAPGVEPQPVSAGSVSAKRVTFRAGAEIIGVADNIDRQPFCHESHGSPHGGGGNSRGLIASRLARRFETVSYFGKVAAPPSSSHPDSEGVLQTLV